MATLPDVVNGGLDKVSSATNTPLMAPMISSSIFGHKLAVSVEDDAKYPKHLDNVSGGADKRKLTAVYYSNPGWTSRRRVVRSDCMTGLTLPDTRMWRHAGRAAPIASCSSGRT